jgi:biopolymer transport protein ExbD
MAISTGGGSGSEMSDMNVTPLIDVMLVLLITFILNIPVQTHAVKLDLPVGPPPKTNNQPVTHNLEIDFTNQIYWDKQPVSFDQVRAELRKVGQVPKADQPELRVRPDPQAKFEIVDQLLATAQQEHVEKLGFVGNEAYANQ